MKRKTWFLIIGAVLAVGIVATAFPWVMHGSSRALEVGIIKNAQVLQGVQLKIKGQVAPGSITRDDKTQVTSFILFDGGESLSVNYRGIVPDEFKPGANVEVQGSFRADGIFEAQNFGRPSAFCAVCHG